MTKEEFSERLRYILSGNSSDLAVKASAEAAVSLCEGMGVKFDAPPLKTRGEELAESSHALREPDGKEDSYPYMLNVKLHDLLNRAIAEEREACAKMVESRKGFEHLMLDALPDEFSVAFQVEANIARAIRARGSK